MAGSFSGFRTRDGIFLDIEHFYAKNGHAHMVVWPCSMCACAMYRCPVDQFVAEGISVTLLNPRGHGNSEKMLRFPDSLDDVSALMDFIDTPDQPVIFLGHSGGASAALMCNDVIEISRFFLVSPVLDSRLSLFFMYESNTIDSFVGLVASATSSPSTVFNIMKTTAWLNNDLWESSGIRQQLNDISEGPQMGDLMDALFFPGVNTRQLVEKNAGQIEIILPLADDWFPQRYTRDIAISCDIPIVADLGAQDHYFTKSWGQVWAHVLNSIMKK